MACVCTDNEPGLKLHSVWHHLAIVLALTYLLPYVCLCLFVWTSSVSADEASYSSRTPNAAMVQLIMEVAKHLEGAYALLIKSTAYPGELVACKRGSPLILGIKARQSATLPTPEADPYASRAPAVAMVISLATGCCWTVAHVSRCRFASHPVHSQITPGCVRCRSKNLDTP